MNIDRKLKSAMNKFRENKNSQQLNNLEKVHKVFENMVDKGIIEKPQYDLAPISTLPTKVIIEPRI